jgi:hypothetical protein
LNLPPQLGGVFLVPSLLKGITDRRKHMEAWLQF